MFYTNISFTMLTTCLLVSLRPRLRKQPSESPDKDYSNPSRYYQSNPSALLPYPHQPKWNDPDFSLYSDKASQKAWGLRILHSSDIYMYGGGLYSFFENYSTDCIPTLACQKSMISLEKGNERIWLFATSTIGTQNIAVSNPGGGKQQVVVQAGPNKSGFANNVALILID